MRASGDDERSRWWTRRAIRFRLDPVGATCLDGPSARRCPRMRWHRSLSLFAVCLPVAAHGEALLCPVGVELSTVEAISEDGTTVVGNFVGQEYPFRWRPAVGVELYPSDAVIGTLNTVSDDGEIVGGQLGNEFFPTDPIIQPARCSSAACIPTRTNGDGGVPPDHPDFGRLRSVSSDASYATGWVWNLDDPQNRFNMAVRWAPDGTFTPLFGGQSAGEGICGDGSVVSLIAGSQAHRWTPLLGAQPLGFLPGGSFSAPGDVSRDCTTIVGTSSLASSSEL